MCIREKCAPAVGERKAFPFSHVHTRRVTAREVGADILREGAVDNGHLGPGCRNGGEALACNRRPTYVCWQNLGRREFDGNFGVISALSRIACGWCSNEHLQVVHSEEVVIYLMVCIIRQTMLIGKCVQQKGRS